jgi:hypothetical protein
VKILALDKRLAVFARKKITYRFKLSTTAIEVQSPTVENVLLDKKCEKRRAVTIK